MKNTDPRRQDRSNVPSADKEPEADVSLLLSTPTYRYTDLSRSGTEVLIEYEGQIYRLRKTRSGKLILNK